MSLARLISLIILFDILLLAAGAAVLADISHFFTFRALFNLDAEWTLPAAWSGFKLGLLALFFYIFAVGDRTGRARTGGKMIAGLCLLLAFDEVGGIHERLQAILTGITQSGNLGLPMLTDSAAAAMLVALVGLAITVVLVHRAIPFLRDIGSHRMRLATGFALLFIGAALIDNLTPAAFANSPVRLFLKEASEFAGVTVMLSAVLLALAQRPTRLQIGSRIKSLNEAGGKPGIGSDVKAN